MSEVRPESLGGSESPRQSRQTSWTSSTRLSVLFSRLNRTQSRAIWRVDRDYKGHTRYFTYSTILLCFLCFLCVQVPIAALNDALSVEQFFFSFCAADLITAQGLYRPLVVQGEVWRLIVAGFLHTGFIHLCLNMLAFAWMARQLEADFGTFRVAAIYFTSLLCASLLSALTSDIVSVGASGAVLGLYGAKFSHLVLNFSVLKDTWVVEFTALLITVGAAAAGGFLPNIDNAAHLGGFLAGGCAGFAGLTLARYSPTILSNRDLRGEKHPTVEFQKKDKKDYQRRLTVVGFVLPTLFVVIGLSLLMTENFLCDNCFVLLVEDTPANCTSAGNCTGVQSVCLGRD